jgi:hypothetical protein
VNTAGQITVRAWLTLPKAERDARAAEFRDADNALQDNADRELHAGWTEVETPEYLKLNHAVNDLWPTVPWWIRSPALPHPGTRAYAALLAAVWFIALAAAVTAGIWIGTR